jgi:hypothetical protein
MAGSKSQSGQSVGAAPSVDHQLNTTIQVLSECGKPKERISQILGVNQSVVDAALHQDRYAIAAKYLSKKKMPLRDIAAAINMSEARVHGAVYDGTSHAALGGRVLGSALQARLDALLDEDSEMCCPVTLMLFRDPVIASDGFMYEADSVKQLIRTHQNSPITREPLKKEYFQAKQKKSEVLAFREKRAVELLQFFSDASASDMRIACVALDRVVEYLEVMNPAQHAALARKTADFWHRTSKPLPSCLRAYVGVNATHS